MPELFVIQGDITEVNVDIVVNAANTSLLGGGGVDGAIHRKAGKKLQDECYQIRTRKGGCKVGEIVTTSGGNLKAKLVIHTVGPNWIDGKHEEENKLKNCYENSLIAAEKFFIESNFKGTIAFPNISTGRYGFTNELAAKIAINTVKNFLKQSTFIDKVFFVCFDYKNYTIYQNMI